MECGFKLSDIFLRNLKIKRACVSYFMYDKKFLDSYHLFAFIMIIMVTHFCLAKEDLNSFGLLIAFKFQIYKLLRVT